jgi:hypothetical protein
VALDLPARPVVGDRTYLVVRSWTKRGGRAAILGLSDHMKLQASNGSEEQNEPVAWKHFDIDAILCVDAANSKICISEDLFQSKRNVSRLARPKNVCRSETCLW